MWNRVSMLLVVLVSGWVVAAVSLDTWGRTRAPAGPWDAIIVAGCRVDPDGKPSNALAARVRLAVGQWQGAVAAGATPRLVLTGGVGDYPPSEAFAAATLAEQLGVPRFAMVLEETSTSTEENASRSAELTGARRVLVVTDAYHVLRATRVFARYYPEVDAVGSTYGRWSRTRGALREVFAIAGYAARGSL